MRLLILLLVILVPAAACPQTVESQIEQELPALLSTYKQLHSNPELSYFEQKTSALIAKQLRSLGYSVTEHVGKYDQPGLTSYGVVAVLKNGEGPTILLRTDLDALPVEEKTGLSYASRQQTKNELGNEVGVMHACGHDLHMTCFLGTASLLSKLRERWKGTLVLIGQPAEERGAGAKAMLDDGLYQRFPKPEAAIALHTSASLPSGKIGACEGFALANVSSVDIVIRGVGGHGAYPHTTKDPIVIASEVVLALQTIVSRETSPLDPAVVTVGSIHGGTKHNIIPDEVRMELTVRSYKEEVRQKILASIRRITLKIAEAAGVPPDRMPTIGVREKEFTPSTYNDPGLTRRLSKAIAASLGSENVVTTDPVMGGEDFGRFALNGEIPVCMLWLGGVDPAKVQQSVKTGEPLPSLHSSTFTPLPEPAIRTGVLALTTSVLELLKK